MMDPWPQPLAGSASPLSWYLGSGMALVGLLGKGARVPLNPSVLVTLILLLIFSLPT